MSAAKLTQKDINARVLSSEPTDRLGARTIRGGAIAVAATVARTILQILGVAILARLLAPEEFGLVAMGGTVMALVSVLTELNVTTATIQRETLDQDSVSGFFFLNLGTSVAAFLLALAAAPVTAHLFHDARVPAIVAGLAAAIPLGALGAQHNALLIRNMQWLDLHVISIVGFAIGSAAGIAAAWLLDAGYWALIIQTCLAAAATAGLAWIRCPWRPGLVQSWAGATASLKFGLNLSASMLLTYVQRQLDNILIGWRWGSAELGFYSRAYTLLQTPLTFLTGPLGSSMVPAMSRLQNEPEKWRNAYLDALGVITMAGAAMACLLYGGASTLIDIVLGDNWGQTKLIFSNLVIAMLAASPMRTTGWIYISSGRTDRMLQWALIATPLYVTAFLIGLPYGAAALALCFNISQLAAFLPCMWMATRGTNITVVDVLAVVAAPTLAAVAVGLGLAAATARLDLLHDVVAIAVAALLYAVIMAVAVFCMPVYARLRSRTLELVNKAPALRALRLGN